MHQVISLANVQPQPPVKRASPLLAGRGDLAAGDPDLVLAHMPLVRRIAGSVHRRMPQTDLADLSQIGMMALVEAARDYEDRGHAFATYATIRIRGAMIDSTRRSALVSRKAMAERRMIEARRRTIEQRQHRRASAAEMAEALNMSVDDFLAMEASSADLQEESLDEVYSDSAAAFVDREPTAEELLMQGEVARLVAHHIGALPEREAMVLQLYFVEELPLKDIGELMGVGAARVCQIKRSALSALRNAMAADLID